MDEYVQELKGLIRKHIPERCEFGHQKVTFLSQVHPSPLLTEGFKLLSSLVELESCEAHACQANTDQRFVDVILSDNGILCPTLPKVIPDGFKLTGKTLILLETFVRVNPDEFEKKWKADMSKLLNLKHDLQKSGVTLVPIVDGRSNYNNRFVADWVIERIRWLLIEILKASKSMLEIDIEDQEYQRLIHSLSNVKNQSLGLENLEHLKRNSLDYDERLNESLFIGLKGDIRESTVREELIKLKLWFKDEVFSKGLGKFKLTDRRELLESLSSLGAHLDSDVSSCPFCNNKLMEIVYNVTFSCVERTDGVATVDQQFSTTHSNIEKHYLSVLSLCNKIKGLKVFNTRRNTLLFLDLIMVNLMVDISDSCQDAIESLRKSGLIVGQMVMLVNDRVLDILEAVKLIRKKIGTNPNWVKNCSKILERSHPEIWHHLSTLIKQPDFNSLISIAQHLVSDRPIMRYSVERGSDKICRHKLFQEMSSFEQMRLFKTLSSISLSLINSMKTSFSSRLLVNEREFSKYFGNVRLRECYAQRFYLAESLVGFLFYQKTGERSRCYSVYLSDNGVMSEQGSFYCDPKRFFLPVFSDEVLAGMCEEMTSWLDFDTGLMNDTGPILRLLVLAILCSPSKRNQTFLQGLRYFLMAFANQIHHIDLTSKLVVECKSSSEVVVQRLAVGLFIRLLSGESDASLFFSRRFKYLLNVSYLCHLITKETPDRLTDQIKCFEKFIEPKVKFGCAVVNPSLNGKLTVDQEDIMINGLKKFFSKSLRDTEDVQTPGVCKELLNYCVSLFNRGKLKVSGELKNNPFRPNITSTALDLSSNKSVVIPKLDELGNILSTYDKEKLVSACVSSMAERFKTKGRYNLDPDSTDYLILKNLTGLVSAGPKAKSTQEELSLMYEALTEEQVESFNEIKHDVQVALAKMADNSVNTRTKNLGRADNSVKNGNNPLDNLWSPFGVMKEIRAEVSLHEVKDFDPDVLPPEVYKELCDAVYKSSEKCNFFLEGVLDVCPLGLLLKNLTTSSYVDEEYFMCFKYLLIQGHFDQKLGSYEHKSRSRLGFTDETLRLKDEVRLSIRESNSEAIADKLDKSYFTNAALRNLCFYSEDSPTEFTSISSNSGNLKFGLSYKEQVGSNRELYVGDLNTKLMTRLVEDFSEAVGNSMKYTCLNSEKEFERAICDMKMAVNNGDLSCSYDHSKWGPTMSPALFLALLQMLELRTPVDRSKIDLDSVKSILKWHLHKVVEVPINVAEAYCIGKLKRSLGLMGCGSTSLSEEFFHQTMQLNGQIPSHIMSVLDMGQGILHNTSDLYGLITEQFLCYALDLLYDVIPVSYTSSDDQITLIKTPSLDIEGGSDAAEWLEMICFHEFLSSKLNKFVSPKSVIGTFVAEFKSRFFVMGEETPLLTKFVAAALHNVKCKTPTQLSETIDTICDQCIANGVSTKIVTRISKRVNQLIRYSGYGETPFGAIEDQDVKDWVDGSRGYRLQRKIEAIFHDDKETSFIRNCARKVFNDIKRGRIFEENLINLIGRGGDEALTGFLQYAGCSEQEVNRVLNYRWVNLSSFGDLRLVLRTKLMTSRRVLEREEVPTLIKTLQSKLSRNFTKGVKKILAESINKSAFQSSVASGFIGFCKSMGSKCVRDGKGGFLYIKEVYSGVSACTCEICALKPKIIYCNNSLNKVSQFSKPILWDYFSLVLTNACELGEWVFSTVKEPQKPLVLNNQNFFWAVKPKVVRQIEDQLGMNHVLQSIRRNYPVLFDEHLTPFMNDLQVSRTMDSGRLKFLDVCIALDMMNENLGIISHLLKTRDNSVYIVKQSDCALAHIRQSSYTDWELGLSPQQICTNFKTQLVLSSMVNPLVLSTSCLKSFFWFNEVLELEDDSQIELAELTDFALMVKNQNVSRAMFVEDIAMGYVVSNFEGVRISLSNVMVDGVQLPPQEKAPDIGELFGLKAENVIVGLVVQIDHVRMSTKFKLKRKMVYSFSLECIMDVGEIQNKEVILKVVAVDQSVSGSGGNHMLLDGVSVVASLPLFTGQASFDLAAMLIESNLAGSNDNFLMRNVTLDLGGFSPELSDKYSYRLSGPENQEDPLVLKDGAFYVGGERLSTYKVEFTGDLVVKALGALEDDESVVSMLHQLWPYLKATSQVILFQQEDFTIVHDLYKKQLTKSIESFGEWIEFTNFKVAYSKSLKELVISDTQGSFRLKGVMCRPLASTPQVEDNE
uniref:RNA-directed RNA polymerase L n=1 Tax=Machupo virus TaxID=3052317 RepID=Q6XQI0_MACHU|nr:L protein [Mammarenavirus machupoense]